MKRQLIFGGWIGSQILIIAILAWQFQTALAAGTVITLMTKPDEEEGMYKHELMDDYYAQFDINVITDEQLKDEVTWNDLVYVHLIKETDHYVVKSVHKKMPSVEENEIVLKGIYTYKDEEMNTHFITYGFEQISNIDSYGDFSNTDPLQVTFRYGDKWNQYEILDVKKMNKHLE